MSDDSLIWLGFSSDRWWSPEISAPSVSDSIQGLQIPLTPIIGREREIESVCALLRRDDIRLITLTGPGGVGKTRLAFAVAASISGDFPDGVRIVSLAAMSDAGLVAPAIAQTLGIREAGEQPLDADLAATIGARRLLLVLDSFERVIDATPLLTYLLRRCPNVKIMVTSQAVLHATVEQLFPVSPLALPAQLADAIRDAISASAAVRLFTLRATAVSGDFELTASNAAIVAEICRRLDGLPLAIELAAARIRFFSPIDLLARLEKRLPLLSGGPFDAPMRQRTLRDTIAWSYDLLDERSKQLLRHLAIFAGGFTVDAVEASLGQDQAEGIVGLVDQSFLTRLDHPHAESRFTMLDTVREFALEQLVGSGEEDEARRQHARWCLDLLGEAQASLGSAAQGAWADRIDAEMENIREAMRMAKQRDDAETLARIAGGLWEFWFGRGYLTEGRLWLSEALTSAEQVSPETRIELLIGAGALAHAQAESQTAAAFLTEALESARQVNDLPGLAMTLCLLAIGARDQGDYPRAVTLFNESLVISRTIGDAWKITLALNSLAVLYQRQGEHERAGALVKESADLARSLGDQWGTAQAVSNMAHLAHRQGHFDEAIALYEESALLRRELGDRLGEAGTLTNLGRIADRLGETQKAIALHEQSLAVTRPLGDRRGTAAALANLGLAYLRQGELDLAFAACRESLELRHHIGDREGIAISLEHLAEVAVAKRQTERAVRLWAAAAALRDAIGAPLAPSERDSYHVIVSAARSSLTPDRMALIWETGRSLPLDTVIQEALHEQAVSPSLPDAEQARILHAPIVGLTPREVDVLQLLEDYSDREIADRLSIGSRTVSTHVTNILSKLGVNSRTSAVAYAIRRGMI